MADFRGQFEKVRAQAILGRAHLQLWKDLGKRLNSVPSKTLIALIAPAFFGMMLEAHLNTSVLCAAKIFDRHRDSLNVRTILARAAAEKGSVPASAAKMLADNPRDAGARLPGIESVLEAIKTRRDKILAHLDRDLVAKPEEVVKKSQLTVDELENVFSVAERILNGVSAPYWGFAGVFESSVLTTSRGPWTTSKVVGKVIWKSSRRNSATHLSLDQSAV